MCVPNLVLSLIDSDTIMLKCTKEEGTNELYTNKLVEGPRERCSVEVTTEIEKQKYNFPGESHERQALGFWEKALLPREGNSYVVRSTMSEVQSILEGSRTNFGV